MILTHKAAGSGFAPQARAYSIIPALPYHLLMKFYSLGWSANGSTFNWQRLDNHGTSTNNCLSTDTCLVDNLHTCTTIHALFYHTLATDITSGHKSAIILHNCIMSQCASKIQDYKVADLHITRDNRVCAKDASLANLYVIPVADDDRGMNQRRVINKRILDIVQYCTLDSWRTYCNYN